jgi:tetratricopeptide (TPR) repeat protein
MTSSPPPAVRPVRTSPRWQRRWLAGLLLAGALLLIPAWLVGDWWIGLPAEAEATYVGRATCAECHRGQTEAWHGSDHDLAMDAATAHTVLGDFNDATLEHFGIVSRMYRAGDRFMVQTEGPDGQLHDYAIKYVFGVRPLQQYLVEFDRTPDMPSTEEARLQVLRISWDTEKRRWFYLSPPDVPTKLAPDDPLHWTGAAQNWNHMCASCHSTNVHKNFDLATRTYHTTFSEIDVSCEACHGPGSLHVDLARAKSLFWDRQRGYALKPLKSVNSRVEIETCAPCHSRRTMIHACNGTSSQSYFDCYESELLRPETYYCDGQIRDEVYVYGSFIQSKMYHKGIRCTDCHDPHSTRLKHPGNQVCTSCHQHPAAKYDTPAHHNHPAGSAGAVCVDCHMPATPFMDVDLRRDHSLRVPRPDLSLQWKTPNACTGCHLEPARLPPETARQLTYYADWLEAARNGNQAVAAELARLDKWSADWVTKWYGADRPRHFADALGAAWQNRPDAVQRLVDVVASRDDPAMVRASALWELSLHDLGKARPLALQMLRHNDPQLRAVAVRCLADLPVEQRVAQLAPRLRDPVRLVRIEAANALADVPVDGLNLQGMKDLARAERELQDSLQLHPDLAGSHLMRGVLAERRGHPQEAVQAYRAAIHVQPDVAGPRSNLAQLLERLNDPQTAARYRAEELALLQRDAQLAPDQASIQYRYGLSLYLNGQPEAAREALERACLLEPGNADYLLALALLNERLQRWEAALEGVRAVRRLRPDDSTLIPLEQRLQVELQNARAAP